MATAIEGRVPPHNLDAEASVLGSVLLDSEVLDRLEGMISTEAFYKEAHRRIWEGMVTLRQRRDPVDLVTVSEELRIVGELENIGGLSYLVGLSEATPTAAYADYYARIVSEKWTLRKLISATGEAMKLAFDEEGSLEDILDIAGRKVLEVSMAGAKSDFQAMKDLVHETFEHIQNLYENKGQTEGVRSGFRELDSMIGSLGVGSLNIIAARPSMGKTALALSVAQNVAMRDKIGVAVFSLEMPAVQLVTRMMCSEARIDMNRLRQGQLTDRDFQRLVDVAGKISEAPIYIDDTSDMTLMELRSRARRLHNQHKVGMIVIDYLQLMSGPNSGKNAGENRQQEIAQISRGLKQLARELALPVVALSQLSRAVEARPNKRPMLSDLRESGCLTGDSLVQLADGSRVLIAQLVGRSGFEVLALNETIQKLEPATVSRAFSTGVKPVFRITSQLGRSIRATANHKFLTSKGWKRLDEIALGDYLALPRAIHVTPQQSMSDDELALLGHLIGDGCTLPRHSIQYTTRETDLAEGVVALAREVFGDALNPRIKAEGQWLQVYLSSRAKLTRGKHNPLAVWLEGMGAWGLRSYEKRVPTKVFEQPEQAIGRFLRHLWSTDGCIQMREGKRPYPAVYYASSSQGLAWDVQSLLLRLGINARVKRLPQTKSRDQFHVIVSGQTDLMGFVEQVGAVGTYKQTALAEVQAYLKERSENTNRDVIPLELWLQPAKQSMAAVGMTHRELHGALGMSYAGMTIFKQNLSRERARRIAQAVQSNRLEQLAQSDVYWDTVATIEPDGLEEVFDLTVPGPHNFVANNIIVHNSIEQDADLVMFIYRDEYYNQHSEKTGIAEIIVGKQRNGPTGTAELQYHAQHVRFNDLARDEV